MANIIPVIKTQRLSLQPLTLDDAQTLYEINQEKDVLKYFPVTVPPPIEKVQRFVASQSKHWDQYGYGNWGILPDGGIKIIGWAGLQFLPETGETEVGFLLSRSAWGRGYATEAAQASLRFGFTRFTLEQIIALVHHDNLASRRVIQKCDMTFVENKVYFGIELLRYVLLRSTFSKIRWSSESLLWHIPAGEDINAGT
jgi:[ribosomal protein S5]-alanine N-acetyltransferase